MFFYLLVVSWADRLLMSLIINFKLSSICSLSRCLADDFTDCFLKDDAVCMSRVEIISFSDF